MTVLFLTEYLQDCTITSIHLFIQFVYTILLSIQNTPPPLNRFGNIEKYVIKLLTEIKQTINQFIFNVLSLKSITQSAFIDRINFCY